ncbi:hypothetical protein, conserved in T. vivax [Trypanosoma vivax Y486]|uniref:Uncharacterized protein n=1 Tax=Trypanosoma vivax (strain Y486) TaxID=1055687 RepID=F9WPZ8_TRYVY|nr:hypothetical protein, conserved in T. vivax [Trypanosoma vivax Y486]|eukprot:CCD19625.1 hypothetical protein, conserved in T. vivax [Trypanosoma vivax Y486]
MEKATRDTRTQRKKTVQAQYAAGAVGNRQQHTEKAPNPAAANAHETTRTTSYKTTPERMPARRTPRTAKERQHGAERPVQWKCTKKQITGKGHVGKPPPSNARQATETGKQHRRTHHRHKQQAHAHPAHAHQARKRGRLQRQWERNRGKGTNTRPQGHASHERTKDEAAKRTPHNAKGDAATAVQLGFQARKKNEETDTETPHGRGQKEKSRTTHAKEVQESKRLTHTVATAKRHARDVKKAT